MSSSGDISSWPDTNILQFWQTKIYSEYIGVKNVISLHFDDLILYNYSEYTKWDKVSLILLP